MFTLASAKEKKEKKDARYTLNISSSLHIRNQNRHFVH